MKLLIRALLLSFNVLILFPYILIIFLLYLYSFLPPINLLVTFILSSSLKSFLFIK